MAQGFSRLKRVGKKPFSSAGAAWQGWWVVSRGVPPPPGQPPVFCPVSICRCSGRAREPGWACLPTMHAHIHAHRLDASQPQTTVPSLRLGGTRYGTHPSSGLGSSQRWPGHHSPPHPGRRATPLDQVLTRALASAACHNDPKAWKELLVLPRCVLCAPPRGGRVRCFPLVWHLSRRTRFGNSRHFIPGPLPPLTALPPPPDLPPDPITKPLHMAKASGKWVAESARSCHHPFGRWWCLSRCFTFSGWRCPDWGCSPRGVESVVHTMRAWFGRHAASTA